MVGFDYNNHIATQTWNGTAFYNVAFQSFVLPLNTWTHVAATFSTTNGLRIFVNGTLANVTSPFHTYASSNTSSTVSIGTCTHSSGRCNDTQTRIVPGQYRGKVDEMRIYSRELTTVEIQALVNV
jgi:hypothetical protein